MLHICHSAHPPLTPSSEAALGKAIKALLTTIIHRRNLAQAA